MKGVYQRGNVWWIRYRFNGQLIRKSIGYDKRLAEEALKAIRGDIVRGEYRLRRNGDKRLFKEMVQEYLDEKVNSFIVTYCVSWGFSWQDLQFL